MREAATVILIPVLNRPHRAAPLLQSIKSSTGGKYRVLFICSPMDHQEMAAITAAGGTYMVISDPPGPGDYAKKINTAYLQTDEEFLFLGADDLDFHPGWLDHALQKMKDKNVGVVGTQDLGNPAVKMGQHSTHSLVRREYVDKYGTIDEPNKILHEGYPHEFVDNEFIETAKARGAFVFAHNSVVEHLHPHWGKAPDDETYAKISQRMTAGRKVYHRRQRLWRSRTKARTPRRTIPKPQAAKPPDDRQRADVTIGIATYGNDAIWGPLANRALASVERQTVQVQFQRYHSHEDLCHARNTILDLCETEWLIYLDADDQLPSNYVAMLLSGSADVRAPAVEYRQPRVRNAPRMPRVAGHRHDCSPDCLLEGNWLVVGSMAKTDLLRQIGGWRDFPVYEDWDLWLRCHLAGATIEAIPKAIYIATVRPLSRNRGQSAQLKHETHQAIAAANGVPIPQ